jgi:ring-1,2-phenylacetyl-CoA epoxidase subunit PaaD
MPSRSSRRCAGRGAVARGSCRVDGGAARRVAGAHAPASRADCRPAPEAVPSPTAGRGARMTSLWLHGEFTRSPAPRQVRCGEPSRRRRTRGTRLVGAGDDPRSRDPAISLVELGVIGSVSVDDVTSRSSLLPTFVGCPAIGVMQERSRERLARSGGRRVTVRLSFDPPWTSRPDHAGGPRAAAAERLRATHRALAVGGLRCADELAVLSWPSARTAARGTRPSRTRSVRPVPAIYHCADCRQPFEQFKRI